MNISRLLSLLFLAVFSCAAAAQDIYPGYLREINASTAPDYNNAGSYEYLSGASLTVINLHNADEKVVKVGQMSFNVQPAPKEWHFYERGGGYIDKAGTKELHELKIALPDCNFGNVCQLNGAFSARIPAISASNSHKVEFFVNGKDVSELFYYDESRAVFAVKEFYEERFFAEFQGKDAQFSWKHGESSGKLNIVLGNRLIKGRIVDANGKPNPVYANKQVRLKHAGNDKIVPHEVTAVINAAGEYAVSGLPSFEYNISVDILPSVSVKLDKLSLDKGMVALELSHALPVYDMSFTTASDDIYCPGELVILEPTKWDKRISGDIKTFRQLSGDKVQFNIHKNTVALITPTERVSTDDPVFYCEVGSSKILFKILLPSPNNGYEQFSMFATDGIYARTAISRLDQGGVFPYKGDLMPVASINTISRIRAENVKVHYYNGTSGKASDITDMFIWSDSRQAVYGSESAHAKLYNILSSDTGTLAVTFCENNDSRCFRIKHDIRPGGAQVAVNFEKPSGVKLSGAYIVLEELHKHDNSIYRMDKLSSDSSYRFSNIPKGVYLVKVLDTNLKFYGSAVLEVSEAQNKSRDIVSSVLKVHKNSNNADISALADGNIRDLLSGHLVMHHNDYKLLELSELGINGDIDELKVLGQMPGEYILYQNKMLALFSAEVLKDNYATILIRSGDVTYRLPVYYQSSDYVIVKERGLDYTMCPEERPLCSNAFVSVGGVSQGIYDGSKQLSITLPVDFPHSSAAVSIGNADITNLFTFNKRTITLKKEYLAAFLSTVASDSKPLHITLPDREYLVYVTPGYKSLDVSVVDHSRVQSPLYTGIQTMLSCEYLPNRYYSQVAAVNNIGVANFTNLPECSYSLDVVDRDLMFQGHMEGIAIGAGQNKLRTVFAIDCAGSNNIFVNNCEPFLPVLQDRKLITPDFGVFFTDRLLEGGAVKAELLDKSADVQYYLLTPGVMVVSSAQKPAEYNFVLTDKAGNKENVTLKAEPLSQHMIKMIAKPIVSTIQPLSVEGVNSSYVYTGNFPLVFKMGSSYKYSKEEVSILFEGRKQRDIGDMFVWDASKSTLTLKETEYNNFISLLGNKQQQLSLSFGDISDSKHYMFMVTIGAGAGDISGTVTGSTDKLKSGKAIIIGRRAKNNAEYRQLVDVKSDNSFVFSNVPAGLYDLVIFDQSTGVYGKREINIDRYLSDIYIEIPVKEFK